MTTHSLDTLGLKCPQPILKVAVKAKELQPGDVLEIMADCHSFHCCFSEIMSGARHL